MHRAVLMAQGNMIDANALSSCSVRKDAPATKRYRFTDLAARRKRTSRIVLLLPQPQNAKRNDLVGRTVGDVERELRFSTR